MLEARQDGQMTIRLDTQPECEEVIREMLRLFRGDRRRVMHQKADGSYGPLHLGGLSKEDLGRHLRGEVSISIYLLDADCKCSTLCFDVDMPKVDIPKVAAEREEKKRKEFLPIALRIMEYIQSTYNVPPEAFLLEDTGGRGYHVWLFLEEAQRGDSVVAFAHEVKRRVGVETVEVFPSNWRHGPSGFSKSNVRLPLGVHRKYPEKRSTFVDATTGQSVPFADTAAVLRAVSFVSPTVLESSRLVALNEIDSGAKEPAATQDLSQSLERVRTYAINELNGSLGDTPSLCPALDRLVSKARCDGHLEHHERVALALSMAHCKGGQAYLHTVFKNCTDYSPDRTQAQLDSLLRYLPISCKSLQSPKYNICDGWCHPQLKRLSDKGHSPTPLTLFGAGTDLDKKETDTLDEPLIDLVLSMENLLRAWRQACVQARERDMFEDVTAYRAFEDCLESNLHILRCEILSGDWRHQPFRVVLVPKTKEEPNNTRPMCWSSPWDSIAACAVLNVIGPTIDSTLHANSLGNRLVRGLASDGQIFEDWRKQNRFRELRIEGFSQYGEDRYYVLTDMTRCYEFIQHDRLMTFLRARIDSQHVLEIISQFLKAPWLLDNIELPRGDGTCNSAVGLPQGPALSAFLANVYLDPLDNWLETHCLDFVRYVDDLALVFENKEQAETTMGELRRFVEEELGLKLSDDPKKTLGPFPTSNVEPLQDWLRDARYQLTKYSRQAGSLTSSEKDDLRAALSTVSGAGPGEKIDFDRLVKYLGFYVANTERLDQESELQKGVYTLALYVLNERRPKHNATCIAIRALIKACCEFGDAAWAEFKRLLDSRSDAYIRVVLMQEARRYVQDERTEDGLHSTLKCEIARQVLSSSQTVAAAAMECMAAVGASQFPLAVAALCRRLLGDDGYLRPRAALLLSQLGALDSTGAARIAPGSGDEAALFLFATWSSSIWTKPVVDALANALRVWPATLHAIPALLFASLATGSSTGIQACVAIESFAEYESLHHMCHHVAARYIQAVVAGSIRAGGLPDAIQLSFEGGLGLLGHQLHDLGRYSRVISETPQIDKLIAEKAAPGEKEPVTAKLPTLEGVSLGDLILSPTPPCMWLHKAEDADGLTVLHEVITESGLQPYGYSLAQLADVLRVLRNEGLLLFDDTQMTRAGRAQYLMTKCASTNEWHTIAEMLHNGQLSTAQQRVEVVVKAAALLNRAGELMRRHDLPMNLLPVPTCHSLVMDEQGSMRFRTILATLAGGRHYVGLDLQKAWQLLPREQWEVYAMGLLFFEVVTGKCAVVAAKEPPGKERLADTAECQVRGPLFSGIVGKATAGWPDSRYKGVGLLVNEVKEWSTLETAIAGSELSAYQINQLRRFWQTQISLERRAHEITEANGSLLDSAPELATYVLGQLEQEGQPGGMWSDPQVRTIAVHRNGGCHVATLYTMKLAEKLQQQWKALNEACGLRREFTCADWLVCAAALCEMETIRRKLFVLARTTLSSACLSLCTCAADAAVNGTSIHVRLRGVCGEDKEGVLATQLTSHLRDVSDQLHPWLAGSTREIWPGSQWTKHLPLMATLIVILKRGLTVQRGHSTEVPINTRQRGKPRLEVVIAAECMLRLHRHELLAASCPASIDANVIHDAAELASTLCRLIPRVMCTRLFRGSLPANSFTSLYASEWSKLNLGVQLRYKKPIWASRESLLPFPGLSPSHRQGCPFSLSLVEGHGIDNPLVLALSLPPVVERVQDRAVYPLVEVEAKLAELRAIMQRFLGFLRAHRVCWYMAIAGVILLLAYLRASGRLPDNPYIDMVSNLLELMLK